jgi:DNA polymerase-1
MREFSFKVCGEPIPVHVPERADDLPPFYEWVKERARRGETVAVDSETKGLRILNGEPGYVRVVQYGTADVSWNLPIELGGDIFAAARWALETLPKVCGHNYHGYDALAFHKTFDLDYDMLCDKATDTYLLAKLVDPRKEMEGGIGSGLKPLSAHFIDPQAADTQGDLTAVFRSLKLTKATGFAKIDLFHPIYQAYAGGDVILTSRLLPKLIAELDRLGIRQTLRDYEHEIAKICGRMTIPGLIVDKPYTRELSDRLAEEAAEGSAEAARYGVEKIGSPKQLIEAFTAMGETWFPDERTAGGALAVNKTVLARFADINSQTGERIGSRNPNPLAVSVIKAKRAAKWKSAYADHFLADMDADNRIHHNIRTMEARTGRMSVTNPAVQTLPSGDWMIRRCFLAEEGHVFVSTDFNSVELNVLAALADVKRMKEAILRGEKLHKTTTRMVYGDGAEDDPKLYKYGKVGNFLVVYGGRQRAFMLQTGCDADTANRFFSLFERAYPEVERYGRSLQREAYSNGMVVWTATGRRLPLDRDRTFAATNYAVQSAARDCLGRALVRMENAGLTQYLRLVVHDETIASVPREDAEEVGREIARCMTFDLKGVPISADPQVGGRSWGSLYGAAA